MSETTGFPSPLKLTDNSSFNTPNKSPSKQTFNTIKNFIKSKSSLNELKVWPDSKKEEKEHHVTHDFTYVPPNIHQSTSSSRLSDKFKGPKKKRSLGSLIPPSHLNQNSNQFQHQNTTTSYYQTPKMDLFNKSTDNIHDNKSFIVPIPASQKQHSTASSPQLNFFRIPTNNSYTSSSYTKTSGKNISPTKATFSLEPPVQFEDSAQNYYKHQHYMPPVTPTVTESFPSSKEGNLRTTTIRGKYLHDWSNDSPRSLAESLKVGRVETPSVMTFSSPTQGNNNYSVANTHSQQYSQPQAQQHTNASLISQDSTVDKVAFSSETTLSNHTTNNAVSTTPSMCSRDTPELNELRSKLRLNMKDLTEPSNPLPSPSNGDNLKELRLLRFKDTIVNDESKKHETKPLVKKSTPESDSSSDSESDVSSHHSQGSQFSFLRNRTSSLRFYKSSEQVAREKAIDDDKLERLKFKEFIGTSQDIENDLLEVCSNGNVVDGLDEDVNYVDYEEEDDTDALFNRDLFGLEESTGCANGLEMDDDDNNGHIEHRAPGLELDDYQDEVSSKGLELSDDEYTYKPQGLELELDREEEEEASINNEYSFYAKTLELTDNEADMVTKKTLDNIESGLNSLDLDSTKQQPQSAAPSISENNSKETIDRSKKEEMGEASSKAILAMLNQSDSGLVLKRHEIHVQHRPSATLQRHRSIKFHQLAGNIEEPNIYQNEKYHNGIQGDDAIWEDSTALDEVNQIPEDYESSDEEYESSFDDRSNSSLKSNRYSTMISSESDDLNFISSSTSNGGDHLWKNLIKKNADGFLNARNKSGHHVEKIKLDNRTITLYNNPRDELLDAYEEESSDDEEAGKAELSTIME